MKRIVPIVLLALVLGAFVAGAASAIGVSVVVGAFAGVSIPLLQEDSKQGTL
jgi:hypothetical protein